MQFKVSVCFKSHLLSVGSTLHKLCHDSFIVWSEFQLINGTVLEQCFIYIMKMVPQIMLVHMGATNYAKLACTLHTLKTKVSIIGVKHL